MPTGGGFLLHNLYQNMGKSQQSKILISLYFDQKSDYVFPDYRFPTRSLFSNYEEV
jgi:cyclopropane fatty-acyl-phospholipid synthase-like methyltransferase